MKSFPHMAPSPISSSNSDALALKTVKVGGLKWRLAAQQNTDPLIHVLDQPEHFLLNDSLHFKDSRVVTVVRVPRLTPQQPDMVLRRLNYGKFSHRCRDFFRASRAMRALRQGLMLADIGVRTPKAFAAAEVRRWRWPLRAYLATEEIPGAVTLHRYLLKHRTVPRALIHSMALVLARLHDHGFSHRDLKLTNILLDHQLQPWLIDLDGLRWHRRLSSSRAQADLTRFAKGFVRYPGLLRYSGWRFLGEYGAARNLAHEMPAWWQRLGLSLRV